jgi:hypothetical protein
MGLIGKPALDRDICHAHIRDAQEVARSRYALDHQVAMCRHTEALPLSRCLTFALLIEQGNLYSRRAERARFETRSAHTFVDEATVQCDSAKRSIKAEIFGADRRSASQML